MAGRTLHYADLNAQEVAGLDASHTITLMALSPLEVHGPHLPIATDAIVARELQARLLARLEERYPDYDRLVLPTFHGGADTIPVPGSIDVDSRAIYHLLVSTGRSAIWSSRTTTAAPAIRSPSRGRSAGCTASTGSSLSPLS